MGYHAEQEPQLVWPRELPASWKVLRDPTSDQFIVAGADDDTTSPRVVVHVTYATDMRGFDLRHEVASAISTALDAIVCRCPRTGVRTR